MSGGGDVAGKDGTTASMKANKKINLDGHCTLCWDKYTYLQLLGDK
jgi:hypothetical protein